MTTQSSTQSSAQAHPYLISLLLFLVLCSVMPTPYAPYAAVTALFGGALAWLRGPTTSDTHNGTSDKDLDSQDVKAADDGGPGSSVNSGGTFRGAVKPASVEVLPDAGDLSRQSGPLVEEPAPGVARHYGQPTEDEVTASASQLGSSRCQSSAPAPAFRVRHSRNRPRPSSRMVGSQRCSSRRRQLPRSRQGQW